MNIFLQDTLSGEKKKFEQDKSEEVLMYSCGPTVYDYAHIGNFRTFIMSDILKELLNITITRLNM